MEAEAGGSSLAAAWSLGGCDHLGLCTFARVSPRAVEMRCVLSSARPGTPRSGGSAGVTIRSVDLLRLPWRRPAAGVHPVEIWGSAEPNLLFCRKDEFDALFCLPLSAKRTSASSSEQIFAIRGFGRCPTSQNNWTIFSHLAALLMQHSTLGSYNTPGRHNIINSCRAK